MSDTQIFSAEAFSVLFQKLAQHLEQFWWYKECLEKAFQFFFSVSLQSIGDGGMEIIKMKVFSVRHTFIGGNNNHSATTEEPVCVLSWSVLAYVFKLHLANCWHLMKKVCLHKEVAFIVEVFFCLYKFAIFLNTEFRFGDTCFMLEKKQTFGESFSVLNITV